MARSNGEARLPRSGSLVVSAQDQDRTICPARDARRGRPEEIINRRRIVGPDNDEPGSDFLGYFSDLDAGFPGGDLAIDIRRVTRDRLEVGHHFVGQVVFRLDRDELLSKSGDLLESSSRSSRKTT